MSRPDPNTAPIPPQSPEELEQQAAFDEQRFADLLHDAEGNGTGPNAARRALDGQVPAVTFPYAEASRGAPPYNRNFQQRLAEALAAAARTDLVGLNPETGESRWEERRRVVTSNLREALAEDRDQIGAITVAIAQLQANSTKAGEKVGSAHATHARATSAVHTLERQRDVNDPEVEVPEGMQAIAPPPPGADVEAYYAAVLRDRLGSVRRLPGANKLKAEIRGYVAETLDRARHPELLIGRAVLAESVALTGRNGVNTHETLAEQDHTRNMRFAEILQEVQGVNLEANPDVIQERFGRLETPDDVAAYKTQVNEAMLAWRTENTLEAEHGAFIQIHRTRAYLRTVRASLNTMSAYDTRYASLRHIHDELSQINNAMTYQSMLQRFENASDDGGNFRGRYPVSFSPDAGIYQQGSTSVYYPDGTTAPISAAGIGTRIHGNGEAWRPPTIDSSWQGRATRTVANVRKARAAHNNIDTRKISRTQLGDEYDAATDSLFTDPSDSNRERAQAYASAIKQKGEAELKAANDKAAAAGNAYVEDPTTRRDVNACAYRAAYHSIKPGEMPTSNNPRMMRDGTIELPSGTLNGVTGRWHIRPNGAAASLDEHGNLLQLYAANGVPY